MRKIHIICAFAGLFFIAAVIPDDESGPGRFKTKQPVQHSHEIALYIEPGVIFPGGTMPSTGSPKSKPSLSFAGGMQHRYRISGDHWMVTSLFYQYASLRVQFEEFNDYSWTYSSSLYGGSVVYRWNAEFDEFLLHLDGGMYASRPFDQWELTAEGGPDPGEGGDNAGLDIGLAAAIGVQFQLFREVSLDAWAGTRFGLTPAVNDSKRDIELSTRNIFLAAALVYSLPNL